MTESEGSFRERRSAHAATKETGSPSGPAGELEVGPGATPDLPPEDGEPKIEGPEAGERREPGPTEAHAFPEGAFFDVVQYVVLRASQCLGEIPFDETGEKRLLPREAKAYIDLLSILRERTREELSPEAAHALETLLSDLRMRYLELA